MPLLAERGITPTDVLLTHHHRDQGQGLVGISADIRIWVPHSEQDLFASVNDHWQARQLQNNYNTRQDRFSVLENIPIAGTLRDYATYCFGAIRLQILPTPGHTPGSITIALNHGQSLLLFTGDLLMNNGKLWSLAATQWTYNGAEGVPATIASVCDLQNRQPDFLLPAHGEPIDDPASACGLLIEILRPLLTYRRQNPRLFSFMERPYEPITPHLLRNRTTSMSNAYVLLSDSGKALLFDYGYDFVTGLADGQERAARRPWLYTLPALKAQFGVHTIDAVVPTHFHDDHVAGINLLREVEGVQNWSAENFADILEHPLNYNLPCLWYDPIPVDRILPLGETIQWEEYEFTLYSLPGHTRYAVAILLVVDGKRVLISGDQYAGEDGLEWNYVYQNDFRIDDYVASAALYRQLAPDVVLSGHWSPLWVEDGYFNLLEERGNALARLHRELLPTELAGWQGQDCGVTIAPYQAVISAETTHTVTITLINPTDHPTTATVKLVATIPIDAPSQTVELTDIATVTFQFTATQPVRRARIAADVTIGNRHWGQLAEALLTVLPNAETE